MRKKSFVFDYNNIWFIEILVDAMSNDNTNNHQSCMKQT